jgi:hypothetical protein
VRVAPNQSKAASFSLLPDHRMIEGWCVNLSTCTSRVRQWPPLPRTYARIHMRWVWVGSADLVGHLGGGGGQEFLVARVHGAREHELCTPGVSETSTSQSQGERWYRPCHTMMPFSSHSW